jgi:nucleoid DNA-binding protein
MYLPLNSLGLLEEARTRASKQPFSNLGRMKKTHMAERVADKLGVPKKKVADQLDDFIEKLMKSLEGNKRSVRVRGFGTIQQPEKAAVTKVIKGKKHV